MGCLVPAGEINHPVEVVRHYVPLPNRVLKPDQIGHIARQSDNIQLAIAVHIAGNSLVSAGKVVRQRALLKLRGSGACHYRDHRSKQQHAVIYFRKISRTSFQLSTRRNRVSRILCGAVYTIPSPLKFRKCFGSSSIMKSAAIILLSPQNTIRFGEMNGKCCFSHSNLAENEQGTSIAAVVMKTS